jgi:hypothetical protein
MAGFKDSGVRRLTEPIDDFRASSEESSPHAYERRISGVPLGGSSGREWHFQFDETEIFWDNPRLSPKFGALNLLTTADL